MANSTRNPWPARAAKAGALAVTATGALAAVGAFVISEVFRVLQDEGDGPPPRLMKRNDHEEALARMRHLAGRDRTSGLGGDEADELFRLYDHLYGTPPQVNSPLSGKPLYPGLVR